MKKIITVFGCFFLCSCQPNVQTHGNISIVENLPKFEIGKTKIADVYRICGQPSLKKDDFTLIYMCWKTDDISFKKLKVRDKTSVRLLFDHNGVLKKIEKIEKEDDEKAVLVSNEEKIKLLTEEDAEKVIQASNH